MCSWLKVMVVHEVLVIFTLELETLILDLAFKHNTETPNLLKNALQD